MRGCLPDENPATKDDAALARARSQRQLAEANLARSEALRAADAVSPAAFDQAEGQAAVAAANELEARAALVRAALALRAYRNEHATYPATWPSAADSWAREIRYRREGSGFVISAPDRQGKVIELAWD